LIPDSVARELGTDVLAGRPVYRSASLLYYFMSQGAFI
jgi:hypothetical protein